MKSAIFLLLALGWFLLPLLPAVRELLRPTDKRALEIYQGNAADALASTKEARDRIAEQSVVDPVSLLETTGVLVWAQEAGPDQGWISLAKRAKAVVFPGHKALQRAPSHLQSVHADTLEVLPGAAIEPALTADRAVVLHAGAQLRTVQAPVIQVPGRDSAAAVPAYWADIARTVNDQPSTVSGAAWEDLQEWWRAFGDARVAADSLVEGDIVASGDVVIEKGARVTGSIKAAGTLHVMARAQIQGDCVAEHIVIEEQAWVLGSVVAEQSARLQQDAQVGAEQHPSTVVATDIWLREGVSVFGGLAAHRCARVLAPNDANPKPSK